MSCNHPFKAFETGRLTDNGKRELLIYPSTTGNLVSLDMASRRVNFIGASAPIKKIGNKVYLCDPIPIPCGSCSGCRMDKAREWRDRLCLEAAKYDHHSVWFLTLTYDDIHMPRLKGQPVLSKRDVQLFLKRLRKYIRVPVRYFCSGEYGSLTLRPHYHFILFCQLDVVPGLDGGNSYRCEAIEKTWTFGLYDLQMAEPGSIAYTAGYVEKKQLDPNYGSYLVKPFLLMSRRPGIGFDAIKPLTAEFKIYGDFGTKHYSSIPTYFKKKLENDPLFAEFKAKSIQKGKDALALKSLLLGTKSEEVIGFAMDDHQNAIISNKLKGEKL